jgi:hypothetical protein
MQNSSQQPQFPGISFSGCGVSAGSQASFQRLGYNADDSDTYDAYQAYIQAVKITGNHSLKFGGEFRDYRWSAFKERFGHGAREADQ